MKQGTKLLILCALFALLANVAPAPAPLGATAAHAATKKSSSSSSKSESKAKHSLRQFTGTVTALDKTSITVEKSGKKPKTMVFSKHDEMRTQGEIEKDARVTVYYREEGGQAVAHRVVVKAEKSTAKSGR